MPSRSGGKKQEMISAAAASPSPSKSGNDVISQRGGEHGDNGMGQKMCEEERDLGWMTVLLQRKRARGAVKDKTTSLFFVVRTSDVSMLPSLSLDFLTLSSEISFSCS